MLAIVVIEPNSGNGKAIRERRLWLDLRRQLMEGCSSHAQAAVSKDGR
jgi:hypothetical protein